MKKIVSFIIATIMLFSTVYADIEFNLTRTDCGETEVSATHGSATLTASADGVVSERIDWDADPLRLAPRIQGTASANGWQQGGFWQIQFSSADMQNLKLYADMFSSGKGPSAFKLQYSTDGVNYINIPGSVVQLDEALRTVYNGFSLPSAMAGKDDVYLRFVISSPYSLSDALITGVKDGSTYINNILITSTELSEGEVPDVDVKPVLFESQYNKIQDKWGTKTGRYNIFIQKQ